eukprot:TRINITY_DN22090_c0_g1_i1.p1 TRINITY_DN22090_c0_g1~~TRINITY_DN22090_c0_g1_i1.p1  ORF type:complete len:448 (+),score=110.65 TRINITY_DN22090_c0_g1_i1:189-1346(+)
MLTDLLTGYSSKIFQAKLQHLVDRASASGAACSDVPGRWELARKVKVDVLERFGFQAEEQLTVVAALIAEMFPELASKVESLRRLLRLSLESQSSKAEEPSTPVDLPPRKISVDTTSTDVPSSPALSRQVSLSGTDAGRLPETDEESSASESPKQSRLLSKKRALALQTELHAAFTAPRFQLKLQELWRKGGKDSSASRAAFVKLVRKEQMLVIPRYGFEASEDGVSDMTTAFEEFADDPDVFVNTTAINEALFGPGDVQLVEQELKYGKKADTKDFVTSMLRAHMVAYSHPAFQRSVRMLMEKVKDPRDGYYRLPGRAELAMEVQSQLLPRFGFEASRQGVQDMIVHCSRHLADPEDAINSRLGMTETACRRFRRVAEGINGMS